MITYKDIIATIIDDTPGDRVPKHHIKDLNQYKPNFYITTIKITDIWETHPEVKQTIMSLVKAPRYTDKDKDCISDKPIIMFNGKVIDGYSRLSRYIINGYEYIKVITNQYVK